MSYSKRSDKFKKLLRIRKVLEKESDQFPEAMCDCATRLIYEEIPFITIMNGSFNGKPHVWAYDMEQKVHIDLTLDQFNSDFDRIRVGDEIRIRGQYKFLFKITAGKPFYIGNTEVTVNKLFLNGTETKSVTLP